MEKKQDLSTPLLQQNTVISRIRGCPGCKTEEKKRRQKGIPYKEIISIWMVVLCAALPISSLFPFIYFMIRDFHISDREEDIGYYAGYLGSSFMLGRALTSLFWGLISDHYGRKPVIIIGILTVVIFNTLFGLSLNFYMAISTRFLLGGLNGLLGPIKAYSLELFPQQYQPLGLSSVATAWALGLIIGPALGGFLAQPCKKYPSLFTKSSFFCTFPYLLPCLSISLFAFFVLIFSFFLPETLHFHPATTTTTTTPEEKSSFMKLLRNWELMSSVIVYCVFSLHDMAYTEVFSLWAVSGREYGGLGFSTKDVGMVLVVSGVGLLVVQMWVYSAVVRKMGTVMVIRTAGVVSVFILGGYPFIAEISGFKLGFVVINLASVVKNSLSLAIVTGLFLLQNNAVRQSQRGAANGVSMTAMSVFKAVGPAGGGALFSWAQTRRDAVFLPRDHLVFFVLNLVEVLGVALTFKPFLVLPLRNEDDDADGY